MPASLDDQELDAIRRRLEERRDRTRERVAALAKRPERGTAQGFGKRIGDGTVEAISRLTEIGVGSSLEGGLLRTRTNSLRLPAPRREHSTRNSARRVKRVAAS